MARTRIVITPDPPEVEDSVFFVPTGSTLLDLVMGGGYALGRIVNLVGDRSSGKTLLAVEACANFVLQLGKAEHCRYIDAESAFVESYAAVLGMPSGIQTLNEGEAMETVQEFFADFEAFLQGVPDGEPCMYILDSLDSLSDTAEMDRDYDKGSYGGEKPKLLSQFFRRSVSRIKQKNCLLIIVSQIRDKIGVTFGETKTRSGGKALDFYASQILWLSELKKLRKTAHNVERAIGIEIKARNKKNKVGLAYRDCEMTIVFNYGIDDEISMLKWIKASKAESALSESTFAEYTNRIEDARKTRDMTSLHVVRDELREAITAQWEKIEDKLAPSMRKYGEG